MPGSFIIGGEWRHTRIGHVPPGLTVRPILARIKKSLFDILRDRIPDSFFLDLFAGMGTVGLEALSRGAKKVVFVDSNPRCKKLIMNFLDRIQKSNQSMELNSRTEVLCRDVLSGLSGLNEKFDLIFSGAPYREELKRDYPLPKAMSQSGRSRYIPNLAAPHGRSNGKPQPYLPVHFVRLLLDKVHQDKILDDDGWFIAQHHSKECFETPEVWNHFRQERYGDTCLSFFKHRSL